MLLSHKKKAYSAYGECPLRCVTVSLTIPTGALEVLTSVCTRSLVIFVGYQAPQTPPHMSKPNSIPGRVRDDQCSSTRS